MSIKFSAHGVFRTELRKLAADHRTSLSDDTRAKLENILVELEKYVVTDTLDGIADQVIGSGYDLVITTQFLETNMNLKRTLELFVNIHELIKDKFVPKEIYREMGDAVVELGLDPNQLETVLGKDGRDLAYLFTQTRVGDSWPENSLVMCAEAKLRTYRQGVEGNKCSGHIESDYN